MSSDVSAQRGVILREISTLLSARPRGLTLDQIQRSITPRMSRPTVLLGLQDLHSLGHVRYTGATWRWIGPTPRDRNREPEARAGTAAATSGTDDAVRAEARGNRSRWDEFRRLCLYYAESVLREERPTVRIDARRENLDFVQLTCGIDWLSLEAGRPIRVLLPEEGRPFASIGLRGQRLPTWYLGTPVDVYRHDVDLAGGPWTSLEPLLTLAVRPTLRDDGSVDLEPQGPLEVNPGWLARRFRRRDQRAEFLALIGLKDDANDRNDEFDEDPPALPIASIREAIRALREHRGGWWREFGSLDALTSTPPLQTLRANGLHNRAVLLSQPRLKYAHHLHRELLRLADPHAVSDEALDGTALAALFPHEAPSPSDREADVEPIVRSAEYSLLNDEQRVAVDSAQHLRLTVLTGPPGTGKSLVVSHVMANMALSRRAVLFSSRNHQAIEAVEPALNALTSPERLVMRPAHAWGRDAQNASWAEAIAELLGRHSHDSEGKAIAAALVELEKATDERRRVEASIARRIELAEELARTEQAVSESLAAVPPQQRELVSTGSAYPSVDELDSLLAELVANDARRGLWARILRSISRLLIRCRGKNPDNPLLGNLRRFLERLPRCIIADVGIHDERLASGCSSRLASLRPLLVASDHARASARIRTEIEALPRSETDTSRLSTATERVHSTTVDALRKTAEYAPESLDPHTRQRFAEVHAALRNHRGEPQIRDFWRLFRRCLDELLQCYPLWAVSNLSAHKAMPLSAGIADLLIVDEASQCDIPSAVPLLFRAKRALIVGDPMQLGHIATITSVADVELRRRFGLVGPIRLERFAASSISLFKLAASAEHCDRLLNLRAHYRCHPQIAAYFNAGFYRRSLRVMTNAEALRRPPGAASSLRACTWTHVASSITGAAHGCINPQEIEEVTRQVKELVEGRFDGTIGVVTPFRAQANRINDAVTAQLRSADLDRVQFLASTADGFQGDQRDVVLFSLVAGPGMPLGSAIFLTKHESACRFNVAVSRARSCLRVIGNRDWARGSGITHILQLLDACETEAPEYVPRTDLIGPVWEPLLAKVMKEAGLEFRQQYPACGFHLDFAMVSGRARLDIEVDGETWHRGSDGRRLVDDLYRDHVLRGAGWKVIRFWVYELRENLDGCLQTIRKTWSQIDGGR